MKSIPIRNGNSGDARLKAIKVYHSLGGYANGNYQKNTARYMRPLWKSNEVAGTFMAAL